MGQGRGVLGMDADVRGQCGTELECRIMRIAALNWCALMHTLVRVDAH